MVSFILKLYHVMGIYETVMIVDNLGNDVYA